MKRAFVLLGLAFIGLGRVGPAQASSWCDGLADYGIVPVFCDDFDNYCSNPDPAIGQCPRDKTADRRDGMLRQVWRKTSINTNMTWVNGCPPIDRNASDMSLEDEQTYLDSAPFGGKNVNGSDEGGHVGQSTADIVPGIQAKFGQQYNKILGTDEVPLVLQFTMNAAIMDAGALFRSMGYMEIGFESGTCVPKQPNGGDLDPEVTPTDWIPVGIEEDPINNPGCISCYKMCPGPSYSVHVWWPTICQSYEARTDSPRCPPVPENKIHSVLAVGAVAWLDPNPCHCETPGSQTPQNYHLAFFDGWKWRSLRQGLFPGGGDFVLGHKVDYVKLTIKTNTVDIEHQARQWTTSWQPWVTSTAYGVPRKYLGPFNVLRSGTASGCKLNNGSYTCEQWGSTKAKRTSEGERCDRGTPLNEPDGSKFVSIDNVALLDGVPDINYVKGACCTPPAGTCVDGMTSLDCETAGGFFRGLGAKCATLDRPCCPTPYADDDRDGDVDQRDFAKLQSCITGAQSLTDMSCKCLDKNNDDKIDEVDLQSFLDCATGPEVDGVLSGCNPGW